MANFENDYLLQKRLGKIERLEEDTRSQPSIAGFTVVNQLPSNPYERQLVIDLSDTSTQPGGRMLIYLNGQWEPLN